MVACLLWGGKAEPAGAELRGRAAGAWEPTVPFLQLAVLQGSLARFLPALLPHRQSVPAHLNSPDRPEPFPGGDEKEDPNLPRLTQCGRPDLQKPPDFVTGKKYLLYNQKKTMELFPREWGERKTAFRTQRLVFLNAPSPAHCLDAEHFKVGFLGKEHPRSQQMNCASLVAQHTSDLTFKVSRQKGEITGRNCCNIVG